ncbi:hypothetical protein [Aeromonas hydrophila]|uniref:hypothetical protein n=1 Tax=Aeromonas hydrophila TaxID=644 RepID=UPI002B47B621|nr:hypothetical protein [Aeromonas hydrophila]
MSDMRLLAQVRLLLGHHPFTLADARALEALCIAELWECALQQADDEARHYLSGRD